MGNRFKFRVVVFERYNTTEWEFTRFIENTDKFGVSTNGNVIQENVQGFIVHLPREKTPINVSRTMEAIQCTGLKDKTGKLIFEGDIVIITNINDKNFTEIRQVIFKDCAFQFTLPNSMQIDRPLYCWTINYLIHYKHIEIEVIGNIYENPQLLEEKC